MVDIFDFYGLTIEVRSSSPDLAAEVRRDFAYFRVPSGEGRVQIDMHLSAPPYAELPAVPASVITPRNVCFQNKHLTYIDYFGQGLAIFDRRRMVCSVYGTDADLVREIVYLFVLSTVGQHLDGKGLHRVHGLGMSYRGQGILTLLPSGGGKSTMAQRLLGHPEFRLLSDDTPLIDRSGHMHPFPLRVGFKPHRDVGIPPQYLHTVRRMEFDPKTLIDIDYYHDRLGSRVPPRALLVGARNLGDVSEIAPLSRSRAFKALLKYMVVGLGVYQGLEFLLERGIWELSGKGGIVASRLYNSLRLLARTPSYRFVLGRDPERNCETLLEFIRREFC